MSQFDLAGRVFMHDGRVFRLVSDRQAARLYKEILRAGWRDELFAAGLVETWVPDDLEVEGAALVLEHARVPFESHPGEFTDRMHWAAARCLVTVLEVLARNGMTLKDGHPWNLMIQRGRPVFIDFGSIVRGARVSAGWLAEFYRYFAAPLWLSSRGFRTLAARYRREHRAGFGIALMNHRLVRNLVWRQMMRAGADVPARLVRWLERRRPAAAPAEQWSDYEQAHGAVSEDRPGTDKQRFVHGALQSCRPGTVLDCAANNGFYAFMAARTGAQVAAFDMETACIDRMCERAAAEGLAVTPAVMDFQIPTPAYGVGLAGRSAYRRYRCDMVLALGLVHHVCLAQGLPLEMFCRICDAFARRDILVEFVHKTDMHLRDWKFTEVGEYSLDRLLDIFTGFGWTVFSRIDLDRQGLDRSLLHFRTVSRAPAASP